MQGATQVKAQVNIEVKVYPAEHSIQPAKLQVLQLEGQD